MRPIRAALSCAFLAATALGSAEAQSVGGMRGDRVDRVPRPGTIPAEERSAPMAIGVHEVLSVRAADRVMRLRDKEGKEADVHVQPHVYDLSKLKPGDKVRVDFFRPTQGDPRVRAAGVWPAE
jgi:hypothetical protein